MGKKSRSKNINPAKGRKPISIIVHGGAGRIPDKAVENYKIGTRAAAEMGYTILENGGSSEDAVEAAVRSMESFPPLNCGIGSSMNRERHIQMDAFFMRGKDLDSGAVAGVSSVYHPVTLARKVMEDTNHLLIAGYGTQELALELGMELIHENKLKTSQARERWEIVRKRNPDVVSDTVGAVALDIEGNLASALSTGGTSYKRPGRIGDTPLIGAGGYADNQVGAAAATGIGEDLMKVIISKTALDILGKRKDTHPKKAAEQAIEYLENRVSGNEAGIIIMDMEGKIGWAFNAPRMGYAYIRRTGERVFRSGGI